MGQSAKGASSLWEASSNAMDSGTSKSSIESFILQHASCRRAVRWPACCSSGHSENVTKSYQLQQSPVWTKQDLDNYIHMCVYGPGKMAQLCSSCCSFGGREPSSPPLCLAAHKLLQLQLPKVLSLPASEGTNTRVSYIHEH